jgi:hypothetical protein
MASYPTACRLKRATNGLEPGHCAPIRLRSSTHGYALLCGVHKTEKVSSRLVAGKPFTPMTLKTADRVVLGRVTPSPPFVNCDVKGSSDGALRIQFLTADRFACYIVQVPNEGSMSAGCREVES